MAHHVNQLYFSSIESLALQLTLIYRPCTGHLLFLITIYSCAMLCSHEKFLALEVAAFMQERIRIPEDKMDYYKDMAEMYVGDDVSPDFYGWVFPKYDHVAVGKPHLFPCEVGI